MIETNIEVSKDLEKALQELQRAKQHVANEKKKQLSMDDKMQARILKYEDLQEEQAVEKQSNSKLRKCNEELNDFLEDVLHRYRNCGKSLLPHWMT